jgi:serine protease Do
MKKYFLAMLALFCIVCLTGCISISTGGMRSGGDETTPTGKASAGPRGLGPGAPAKFWEDVVAKAKGKDIALRSDTYVEIARKANPAIVNIFTSTDLKLGIGDPLGIFSLPLGERGNLEVYSLGTGFFISHDGYLLTNAHVIAKADKISVFLHDRSEAHNVDVIGVDATTDLALLKVTTRESLPFLKLADSDAVEMGEMVVAIGNPFGLNYSITTGVISAKNRVLSVGSRRGIYEDFLQTSAQINPGNSGGPLLNLNGDVVGINTAIIAQAQGIGFALPTNMVKGLLPRLARNGTISRGYCGIGLAPLNPMIMRKFEISGDAKGALVASMDPYGPAARAGVQTGDLIVVINGESIETVEEGSRKISVAEVGQQINIAVLRKGQKLNFSFTASNKG